jgi:hypothetical protein
VILCGHYIARFVNIERRKAKEVQRHASQGEILPEKKNAETTKEIWAINFTENSIEIK